MHKFDVVIIGGGPMGIATAIEAKKNGLSAVVVEKGVLVNSLYHFPDKMTFFSTSQRLEIGGVPFMSLNEKPTRDESLEYYRRVVQHWQLDVRTFESVTQIKRTGDVFMVESSKGSYEAKYVVVATGFYSTVNQLHVKGENLKKVSHYYSNAHPYLGKKVAVIGGANSACQVALDLFHKGVDVTMIVRKPELKPTVKYWIKPNIENRIKEGSVKAYFGTVVKEIKDTALILEKEGEQFLIENDYVLAMIGYRPDYEFLAQIGIDNCSDEYRTPQYDTEQQTNIENLYLAGVVCGGLKTNRFMIEDSIVHAVQIVEDILRKEK